VPFPTEKNKHSWFKKLLRHWKELPNCFLRRCQQVYVAKKRPEAELCELSEIGLPIANNCMSGAESQSLKRLSRHVNRKSTQQLIENE
jgi:hypothetical protein